MKNERKRALLPVIIWAVLILTVSSIPDLSTRKLGFTFMDKVAHFIEYSVLGFFVARAVKVYISKSISVYMMSLVLAAAFGILDEIHQLVVPGRTTDIVDMAADILGVAFGSAVFLLASHLKAGTRT